jgi:predicted TIM-barrel fold metal-dependent hydrolase
MRIFDSHFHIIDPRFPLVANDGYLPEPFTVADYLQRTAGYDLAGGAVVSGSFQAFDQAYLRAALDALGPRFVGVTQLSAEVSDAEILALHESGVRAVRVNVRRGGSEGLSRLEPLARRVHDLAGWHTELYIDARELPPLVDRLLALPAVSIDHLGLSREGFPSLLKLAERGAHVKATGFSRGDVDVKAALRDLWAANPDCLMFGTDLPSTRAPQPYADRDLALVCDLFDATQIARVLHDNAAAFYGAPRSVVSSSTSR